MELGVYIHIPFCLKKCFYCDFPSQQQLEHLYDDYITALCREISCQGAAFSPAKVDTVFIGGGTPSVLPVSLLAQLLEALDAHFFIADNAEITLEANPGTLDAVKLRALKAGGVNRLSLGIQTWNDILLKNIGRIHSAQAGMQAVEMAYNAGISNINTDLMYGLPGQSLQDVEESLRMSVSLGVQHISVYGLKVEEGTRFARQLAAGTLFLPEEEVEEAMYDLAASCLPACGYPRYEISNFSRKGSECRHNLKYWRYKPYLGLGAAAHSFLHGERQANSANIEKYIRLISNGQSPVEYQERPAVGEAMAEFTFLALRTTAGLLYSDFARIFNVDFAVHFAAVIEKLERQQLLTVTKQGIFLTLRGMKFGNLAFEAFLPELH